MSRACFLLVSFSGHDGSASPTGIILTKSKARGGNPTNIGRDSGWNQVMGGKLLGYFGTDRTHKKISLV